MTDLSYWAKETQCFFLRMLLRKGLLLTEDELGTALSGSNKSNYCAINTALERVKSWSDLYQGSDTSGVNLGELKVIDVLDASSNISKGISVVAHVDNYITWVHERPIPSFPKIVDERIKGVASRFARRLISHDQKATVEGFIRVLHDEASKAVGHVCSKGYLAWQAYELDERDSGIIQKTIDQIEHLYLAGGGPVKTVARGTQLWHVGNIDESLKIRFGRPLWTTDNHAKINSYENQALQAGIPAFRLHLHLTAYLYAADFTGIKIKHLAVNGVTHGILAYCLKEWANGRFSGVVGTNGGADEVVLLSPESQVEVWQIDHIQKSTSSKLFPARRLEI